jgi:hypothetical protein
MCLFFHDSICAMWFLHQQTSSHMNKRFPEWVHCQVVWILRGIFYWIQENKTAKYFLRSRLFTYDIMKNFNCNSCKTSNIGNFWYLRKKSMPLSFFHMWIKCQPLVYHDCVTVHILPRWSAHVKWWTDPINFWYGLVRRP